MAAPFASPTSDANIPNVTAFTNKANAYDGNTGTSATGVDTITNGIAQCGVDFILAGGTVKGDQIIVGAEIDWAATVGGGAANPSISFQMPNRGFLQIIFYTATFSRRIDRSRFVSSDYATAAAGATVRVLAGEQVPPSGNITVTVYEVRFIYEPRGNVVVIDG